METIGFFYGDGAEAAPGGCAPNWSDSTQGGVLRGFKGFNPRAEGGEGDGDDCAPGYGAGSEPVEAPSVGGFQGIGGSFGTYEGGEGGGDTCCGVLTSGEVRWGVVASLSIWQ